MTIRSRTAGLIATGAAAAALAGGIASTGAGAAEHARAARPAEARAITVAVKSSPVAGLRAVRNRFNVTRIRVSTRSATGRRPTSRRSRPTRPPSSPATRC